MSGSDDAASSGAGRDPVEPAPDGGQGPGRRLAGRIALVTGGGSGIGRAIAIRYAAEGASVIVAGRRSEPLQETTREIRRIGGIATFTRGDVGRMERAEMIVQAATYNFGGLDIVVNAAGQFTAGGALDVDERRWDRLMSTNLKGTWLVSRCAVLAMRERGGGSIVNIAGASGMAGVRGAAAFSASKGGVIALTRSMALDLAPEGIRVNAICPGAFGGGEEAAPEAPVGRAGAPEDVAGLALYLASDESSFVTGGLFPVDGGLLAGTHG